MENDVNKNGGDKVLKRSTSSIMVLDGGSNSVRLREGPSEVKTMKNTPDPSVLRYVLKVKKVAAEEESELLRQASDFEAEMRAWYDWVEKKKMEEEK